MLVETCRKAPLCLSFSTLAAALGSQLCVDFLYFLCLFVCSAIRRRPPEDERSSQHCSRTQIISLKPSERHRYIHRHRETGFPVKTETPKVCWLTRFCLHVVKNTFKCCMCTECVSWKYNYCFFFCKRVDLNFHWAWQGNKTDLYDPYIYLYICLKKWL